LPSLALRRLALAALLCFGIYVALLFASLRTGALLVLERGIAQTAVATMTATRAVPVERRLSVEQRGSETEYFFRVAIDDEVKDGAFHHPFHAQNLLLFLAFGLATPGLALRQRATAIAAGLALVFVIDVGIVIGDLFLSENQVYGLDSRAGLDWGLSQLGFLLRFLHPTGGAFMAPLFIWALVLLGPFHTRVMRSLVREGTTRSPAR
jgi:hypothetical protein